MDFKQGGREGKEKGEGEMGWILSWREGGREGWKVRMDFKQEGGKEGRQGEGRGGNQGGF